MLSRESIELLENLKKFKINPDAILEGVLQGLHRSPFHGYSVDFKEYRPYERGDDIRWIDWKLYARSDRFFVKKFEEETNVRIYLAFDTSNSMNFNQKIDFARNLAAVLSYVTFIAGDAVGLFLFGEREKYYIPPSTKPRQIQRIFETLENLEVSGKTDILSSLEHLSAKIRKRSLILLISDLMDNRDNIVKSLRYFKVRHNEVIVFHVVSREEIFPEFRGEFTGVDLETGSEIPLTRDIVSDYRKVINEHFHYIYDQFKKWGIRAERFFVEDDFETQITRFLAGGR